MPESWWGNAIFSLVPTIVLGLIFWMVMRMILRGDRTARREYDRIEAEERAKLGLPPKVAGASTGAAAGTGAATGAGATPGTAAATGAGATAGATASAMPDAVVEPVHSASPPDPQ
ncbi:hypothetical protein SAMN04487783_0769 [Agrococcus baldri]|uniref:Uncharacterized protein n=1 Tax=Agrococcus baldri TaxID=153730 RepID=A0AA94HL24_9MICO|nr:hypothetical protein [Agrococcus baldri]SFS03648.1 hypothetical protein SAMN04487783_0769 [Agrococcus baldri]